MFERFTDRARRVLVLAQEEARLLSHNFIGTEHILLGLLSEGESIAAVTLRSVGVDLERLRERVEETIGPAGPSTTGSPPFTPRAKKVLELSLREALQLGHNYIGPEHMLLGLLREGEGVAVQMLVGLGADLTRIRQHVIELLAGRPSGDMAIDSEEATLHHPASGAPMGPAPGRSGPRCPHCQTLLEGQVAYRVLTAAPSEADPPARPLHVAFIYCRRCGVTIAHTPSDWDTEPGV